MSHCRTCTCPEPVRSIPTSARMMGSQGSRRNCCRDRGYERWPGEPCPEHFRGYVECRCESTVRLPDGTTEVRAWPHTWSKVFGCPEDKKGPNLGHRGDELWLVDGAKTPRGRKAYYAELDTKRRAGGSPEDEG